ncbi:GTP-binding protein [Desulfitobacterium chlororespirans]|uniref:CobW/HypB/UreG, nucleotide-binding domain n=1 Tax=Desulfitobacterium chlororespirans DSM 11544 TaxID=1121395 RepID=A0A1M7SHI5_9FIRM|nr:GTP-binding protein [Desulfitobacterium chlororespirans]SHN57938.1 CobW/HypB/UreG, nucleotide-binding domain [Desulfitobacterium chlororespirans DSM 11544]
MNKTKFMVVSGFLGAGKTTSMIALAQSIDQSGGKAAIIANDLGAKNLVDADFTSTTDCYVTPLAGGCICYQTEALVGILRKIRNSVQPDLIMSDIPGCGIGALDLVYHRLHKDYGEEFRLAPFLVVVDPERLRMIMPEQADIHLPEEMKFLLSAQLEEADAVVLNKIDLLSGEDVEKYMGFLREACPDVPVYAISAKAKTNIQDVVDHIMTNDAKLKVVDIGYGGLEFIAAENKLSWYNRRFFLKSKEGSAVDYNQVIHDYIEFFREKLIENRRNVPHLKLFATGAEKDFSKASLLGVDYDSEYERKLEGQYDKLRVIINARAACESQLLIRLMDESLEETAAKHHLSCDVFFTECFGMMDEGLE